mgnify:CR=1 FL=1
MPLLCCSFAPFSELGTGFFFTSVKLTHGEHAAYPEIAVFRIRSKCKVNTVAAPVSQMFLKDIQFKGPEPGTAKVGRNYSLFTAQYFISYSYRNPHYAVFTAFNSETAVFHLHHYL